MTNRRLLSPALGSAIVLLAAALAYAEAKAPSDSVLRTWWDAGVVGIAIFLAVLLVGWMGRGWAVDRRRFQALLGELPGGMALYRGRRVGPLWHSPAFTDLLGTPALLAAEGIAEADRPRFVSAFGALRASGAAFDLVLARLSDGNPLRIAGRRDPAGDDLLWVAEADATAAPDGFATLLDSLPFPIWLRAKTLSLAWCNTAYAKLVDRNRAAAIRDGVEIGRGAIEEGGLALARRARSLGRMQEESHHLVSGGRRLLLDFCEAPLADGRMLGFARDVTAVEETQAELARHVAAQDELLEHLGAAIAIFGPDQRLRFYNRAYARLFSHDEAHLRTGPSMDELFDVARERRQIEDLPDFPAFKRAQIRRLMSVVEPLDELMHQPSGVTIRRVAAAHPFGGVMLIHEDVTDRLQLERSYNTLIEVQRDTLDNLSEGIAVFGGDGRLKLSNPAFAAQWGFTAGALAGGPHLAQLVERFGDLLQADDWQALRQQMIAGIEERQPRSMRFACADDRVIDFVALPLPDGGVLCRFADVTDSVRVQRALIERNEALETADRLKTEFLANVSYELRTPLTSIIGFSEMLDRGLFGALNERQAEYAGSIVTASRSLLAVIDDILDLANIEAGYLQLNLATIDVSQLFRDLRALTAERARSYNIALAFEEPAGIGQLTADERRLKQALFNLISNAMKFTPAEGRITVAAGRAGDMVEFTVADTGVGIAAADQARMFEKFVRVGSGRQTGVGLGLALVRSLIDLHAGTVSLKSEPGKGTTVVCRIPAAGPRAQAQQQPAA